MPKTPAAEAIRYANRLGLILVGVLVLGLGGWSAIASINGAVIASGTVVVESNTKRVQHKEGGIVKEISVKNGDFVEAGSLLIRLDNTLAHANLGIIQKQLDEREARGARLRAERDNKEAVTFPESLTSRLSDPEVQAVIDSELSVFAARHTTRIGQQSQLRERISQLNNEIAGLEAQAAAKRNELQFIKKELGGLKELFAKGLVPNTRIMALERDRSRLEGEDGQIMAEIARARGQISEIELQVLQLDRDFLSTVVDELGTVITETAQLAERKIAAEDEARRVEILAPQDGFVHQLSVHTVGGVIAPGETVMLVVPSKDSLLVEVQVLPNDIDQLHTEQPVVLRFPAFNQRTSPELNGVVERVSPDLTTDTERGLSYYGVRIRIPDEERKRLGAFTLVPGMPVEAFIQTGARTALTYLTKPLTDQVARAFREE